MKILVVDDEVLQLKSLRLGLGTEGHSVIIAQNTEEAIAHIRREQGIELIITDYLMPGVSGLELLKVIREEQRYIPVILMTAYGKKNMVIEAMRNHCDGFIEKPFSLQELLQEVERVKVHKLQNRDNAEVDSHIRQIVHQINNPLMAIAGNAQLAIDFDSDPAKLRQRLEAIIVGTEKIREINLKILKLGKSETSPISNEPVDIKWLLQDCLNMFEGLMTVKGISCETDMTESELSVVGDCFGLQQIFRNLILNAIEAMDESPVKLLKITADKDVTDTWISVRIADTGCGVSDMSVANFFDSGETTKINGSGLGLRVVKNMVERHKGKFQLKCREGQPGVVITVGLPAAKSLMEAVY